MRRLMLMVIGLLVLASVAEAQQVVIPPGSAQVLFCGTQQAPQSAVRWDVQVDNLPRAAVTMTPTLHSACPTDRGFTHSFLLAGEPFSIGSHTVTVIAISATGIETIAPGYPVVVDVRSGELTIGFVTVVAVPPGE